MPDTETPHPDAILSSPFLVSTHRLSMRRAEKNGSDFQKQWRGVGPCAGFRTTKASIFFDEKAMSLCNKCAFLFPVCFLRKLEKPARHTGVLKQQCSALARGIKTCNKSESCVLVMSPCFCLDLRQLWVFVSYSATPEAHNDPKVCTIHLQV